MIHPAAAVAHSWMPWSPCVEDCARPDPGEPTVGWPRAWARLVAAAVVLLAALAVVLASALVELGRRGMRGVVVEGRGEALGMRRDEVAARGGVLGLRRMSRLMLRVFGVRLVILDGGAVPSGRGALVVANHVSWLDILAINAVRPARMVAKDEVRRWALIGPLATAAGSIYLDRERLRALPSTVADIAAALRAEASVAVFPEGRTWCGRESGAFRAAAFQAAIDADVPVIPVALRFLVDGRPTPTPAFVGDDTLWAALPRCARLRGLVVEVRVLPPPLPAEHTNRRALARAAQHAIAAQSVICAQHAIAAQHPIGGQRAMDELSPRSAAVRPAPLPVPALAEPVLAATAGPASG